MKNPYNWDRSVPLPESIVSAPDDDEVEESRTFWSGVAGRGRLAMGVISIDVEVESCSLQLKPSPKTKPPLLMILRRISCRINGPERGHPHIQIIGST